MKSLINIWSNPLKLGFPIVLSLSLWLYFAINTLFVYYRYYHEINPAWPAIVIGLLGHLFWILFCFDDLTKPRVTRSRNSSYPLFNAMFPSILILLSGIAHRKVDLLVGVQWNIAALLISVALMYLIDMLYNNKTKADGE